MCGAWLSSIDAYNLFDGNISPNFQCDGYFGGASEDTLFRNWLHGYTENTPFGYQLSLNRFTRNYNMVGNVFGRTNHNGGYSFGNPNLGNSSYTGTAQPSVGDWWADWPSYLEGTYEDSSNGFQELDLDVEETTHKRWNYLLGSGIPVDEQTASTELENASMFRSTKPDWFGTLPWPPIDLDDAESFSLSIGRIPAHARYLGRGYTARNASANTVNVGTLIIAP